MKKHKYIESCWVEELPNGVIHLLINCTQREIYYHSMNDTMYLIAGTEEEFHRGDTEFVFELPKFLPEDKAWLYIQTHMKEKEQISFYWIPYEKEWVENRKFLINND